MDIFTIRLKRRPDLYVGKRNPYYAMMTDNPILNRIKHTNQTIDQIIDGCALFCKPEKYAKVWTSEKAIRQFLSYCCPGDDTSPTYSEYELLLNGNVIPIEQVFKGPKNKRKI